MLGLFSFMKGEYKMLKKTITYMDYNDQERTETFYFHLSEAEIAEMELSTKGGLQETLKRIIDSKDIQELSKLFKNLILKSYGVKSPDGRTFIKNEEVLNDFIQTPAYSDLYMELATNADAAINFILGLLPKKLVDNIPQEEIDKLKQ